MLRGASAPAHHNEAKETAAEEDQGSWFRDGLPNSPPRPLAATYHDEAKETGAEKRYGGWFGRDQRVVVAMQHTAKGKAKCSLPFTSLRPVDLVVTELAVIAFPDGRATLVETAPGIAVENVIATTEAELVVPETVPEMSL